MKLKPWLKNNSISSQDFAKIVGVSPVTVSWWATGKKKPSLSYFAKIHRATSGQVTLEDFIPDTSPIAPSSVSLSEEFSLEEEE